MSGRFNSGVVYLLALLVCLGPGARHAAAQRVTDTWSDRQLLGCSFRHVRNAVACLNLVTDLWTNFAMAALSRVVAPWEGLAPAPATAERSETPILRDGNWVHPTATAFRTVQALARSELGTDNVPKACGPMLSDRQTLVHVLCEAKRELMPSGPNRWREENRELGDLRRRLAEAKCLPPLPEDPCAIPAGPGAVAELAPSDSGVSASIRQQRGAETLADFN